jgi:hypothetical protein
MKVDSAKSEAHEAEVVFFGEDALGNRLFPQLNRLGPQELYLGKF